MAKIKWFAEPDVKHYAAAISYLSLIFGDDAYDMVSNLESVEMSQFKAKDIFRASRLPLLTGANYHVNKNFEKIEDGEQIYPILLVRGARQELLHIADGYHRLCAVYIEDEDALIPCKIV